MNQILTAKLKLSDYLVGNGIPCRPDCGNKALIEKIGLLLGFVESKEDQEIKRLDAYNVKKAIHILSVVLDEFKSIRLIDFKGAIFFKKPVSKKKQRKAKKSFTYKDRRWQELRYKALKAGNGSCCLCGMTAKNGIKLHVDHIKPKSLYPELEYDLNNLQVLCNICNVGKSNKDDTDWR